MLHIVSGAVIITNLSGFIVIVFVYYGYLCKNCGHLAHNFGYDVHEGCDKIYLHLQSLVYGFFFLFFFFLGGGCSVSLSLSHFYLDWQSNFHKKKCRTNHHSILRFSRALEIITQGTNRNHWPQSWNRVKFGRLKWNDLLRNSRHLVMRYPLKIVNSSV